MAHDLDSDQQHAVDHAMGSLLLTAGAGSGKTGVLVARYLKHLSDGVAAANLVAITFTDKAAREMRQRIREAVRTTIASLPPGAEHERWGTREQHLETAAIDTIHGYCTRLLRQHAAAARLDPAFEVLSDGFAAALRNEAVLESLQVLLLADSPAGEDLRELIVLHGWQRIVEAVEGFLDPPDVTAWRAFLAKSSGAIAAEWQAIAKAFVPRLAASQRDSSPAIAALFGVKAKTKEGQSALTQVLEDLKRFCEDPASIDVEALNEAAKVGNHHAAKKLYGEENYPLVRDGYEAIRELLTKSGVSGLAAAPANLADAAALAQRMARVALHAEAAYATRKRRDSVLDFHDLLTQTRDLLRSHDEVRAAVQAQVKFLLLDELQDTDPVQMELVELILGERFRNGGLFAVGDAKQSIYRFRGAEVALFHQLRDSLPEASRRQLVRNYRSRPGILRFVNALCREWFPGEAALVATREERAESAVEFLWAAAAGDKPSADELRRVEAEAIAGRIHELIAANRCQPGDIVLLFRALTNVSIYEAALRERGIDYYLVGGRAFFAQQEVYDLINLLRAIENPFDAASLVGVLRSPFCGLSDDAVTAIFQGPHEPWTNLLGEPELMPSAEHESARRARRLLTTWRQIKDSLPLARLLQRILADSGYDAALLFEPLGDRKLANFWKLQEMAREFDRAGYGLAEFVAHLDGQVRRQPREDQAATVPEKAAHVVRIMSVHQAKGLEFPVVIVPDLGAKMRDGRSQAAWWDRTLGAVVTVPGDSEEDEVNYPAWPCELARHLERAADRDESLRILYVACTRAEELLILSSGVKGDLAEAAGPWLEALAQAFDLNTGECRDDSTCRVAVGRTYNANRPGRF